MSKSSFFSALRDRLVLNLPPEEAQMALDVFKFVLDENLKPYYFQMLASDHENNQGYFISTGIPKMQRDATPKGYILLVD